MKALIVGFGYVGSALANTLSRHGHQVTATARNLITFKKIEELGHEAKLIEGSTLPPLDGYDVICLTMAAPQKDAYELTYRQVAIQVANQNPSFRHLIYTSSTSVYDEKKGGVAYEESPLNTEDYSSKILVEAEETLLSLQNGDRNVCIYRLGEIYGPGREISLKMKKSHFKYPGDGNRFTNMIHLDDICNAFLFAIEKNLSGVYNLVDDDHFLQKDLFDLISKKLELYPVEFTGEILQRHSGNKRVSNFKLKEQGFHWKHPHRVLL